MEQIKSLKGQIDPGSECRLSELQGDEYDFLQFDSDIREIADNYAGGNASITGVIVRLADGEYDEIWVTESSTPYDLQSIYTSLETPNQYRPDRILL